MSLQKRLSQPLRLLALLGWGSIHSQARTVEPHLGIWIKKSAHGKGYGREAIEAVVQWAFHNTEIPALRYDFDRANISSQKLVEPLIPYPRQLVSSMVYNSV